MCLKLVKLFFQELLQNFLVRRKSRKRTWAKKGIDTDKAGAIGMVPVLHFSPFLQLKKGLQHIARLGPIRFLLVYVNHLHRPHLPDPTPGDPFPFNNTDNIARSYIAPFLCQHH